MSNIVTPNQKKIIDPYNQNTAQYNTFDSQVYHSRTINSLMGIYGDNFVVNGFYPLHVNFMDNTFEIILCGGILVQNNVLVQVYENINLILELDEYDFENGYLIIHPSHAFLDTPHNDIKIKIQYISNNKKHILPNGWCLDSDKMYFDIFEYNLETNLFERYQHPSIQIKEYEYYYRGFHNNHLDNLHYNINRHKQTYNVQHVTIMDSLIPSINSQVDGEYNVLYALNGNLINSFNAAQKYDYRFFDNEKTISDLINSKTYNIYNFSGNIILKENDTALNNYNKSELVDISLDDTFRANNYNVKVEDGNIVLEEQYF